MTEAQKTVLNLTSAALFGTTVTIPSETDWQSVYDEIKSQEVVALLYPLTSNLDIPKDVLKQWSEDRDKYLLNNAKNISGHFTVQKLMDEAGIPCVILKGLASASYYPDFLQRGFGDVDFLVPRKPYKKAAALLKANGYKYKSQHDKHKVYTRNKVTYELHRDVVGFPTTSIKKLFTKYISDIFDCANSFEHSNQSCKIPSDRHHAVILLAHTAEHLGTSGMGLRHLCDWAAFVNSMPDDFFSEEMQSTLREMGIWHFASVLTNLCTEYLGLRKCGWTDETKKDYLEALIEDIFAFGEFGRRYEETVKNNPALQSRYSELFKIKSFKTLFSIVNNSAKTLIPTATKVPLLLPIGWVFIPLRYGVRILIGTRSTSMAKDAVVNRSNRNTLSEEWKMFKRDN